MNPKLLVLPGVVLLGGVVTYLTVPLEPRIRLLILISDIFAAAILALVLWRRAQG